MWVRPPPLVPTLTREITLNINKLVSALTVLGVIPESNTKRFRYHLTPTPPRQSARELYVDFEQPFDPNNLEYLTTHYEFLNDLSDTGVSAATLFEVTSPHPGLREFTFTVLPDAERFSIENFLSQVEEFVLPFLINEYLTSEYNSVIVKAKEEPPSSRTPKVVLHDDYRYAESLFALVGCKLAEVTLYQGNLIFNVIPDLE